jgi:FlaA1/EpsC-like NDP-sugar epimerase
MPSTPDLFSRAVLIASPRAALSIWLRFQRMPLSQRVCGVLLTEQDHAGAAAPVMGTTEDLRRLHEQSPFSLAVVCIDRAREDLRRAVQSTAASLSLPVRWIADLPEMLQESAAPPAPASLDLVELIGRTPYGVDRKAVSRTISGKRVLITGAGGSIGSELARVACTFHPSQIILMERSENALFEIDRQLARRFPGVPRKALLHDVVDASATRKACETLRPQVVFHAAAHKHVPLMEDHPAHAVTNNLFGSRSIADAAKHAGAERFVMISSDKAVNPTSVMGATKRLAEMYVQSLHREGGPTSFSMVRFGNVLGSACSVLPIWTAQLAEGGPITVTDERMTRYFMTIHEAAMLVIQSAAIDARAGSACVYVLDMGEPVRILELAQRFIAQHGLMPRLPGEPLDPGCVRIELTGARPGEKLHEELAYAAEAVVPTPYPGINAWRGTLPGEFSAADMVSEMEAARHEADRARVVEAIRRHVPEMQIPSGRAARPEPVAA